MGHTSRAIFPLQTLISPIGSIYEQKGHDSSRNRDRLRRKAGACCPAAHTKHTPFHPPKNPTAPPSDLQVIFLVREKCFLAPTQCKPESAAPPMPAACTVPALQQGKLRHRKGCDFKIPTPITDHNFYPHTLAMKTTLRQTAEQFVFSSFPNVSVTDANSSPGLLSSSRDI